MFTLSPSAALRTGSAQGLAPASQAIRHCIQHDMARCRTMIHIVQAMLFPLLERECSSDTFAAAPVYVVQMKRLQVALTRG